MITLSVVSAICPVPIEPRAYIPLAKKAAYIIQLTIAAKNGQDVYMNEYSKICNLPLARKLNHEITIKEIFTNHWDEYLDYCNSKGIELRESIKINVDKMINCRNLKNGYLFYECPACNNIHIQGLSCHSRFCVSCGKKYRDARALEISKTCIRAPHRHITWTISDSLRNYFEKYHELYDELFGAVNDTLKYIVIRHNKKAKKSKKQLGFISTIHTFGRDMKFNPHIHTLVAECTIDKDGKKESFTHFDYQLLRKSFMTQLLKRLQGFLKENGTKAEYNNFFSIKNYLYKTYDNGFYVHAPQISVKGIKNIKRIVNYVCRYAGHPAMSESRIIKYDRENKMIHYYYDPHEDDHIISDEDKQGRQYVSESIFEFFEKLILHIPEEAVHTTRYYGFYANHSSLDINDYDKLYNENEIKIMRKNLNWRDRLIQSYKYDPIICHCGSEMVLSKEFSYFPGYGEDG